MNNKIPFVFAPITEAHEELISFQLPLAAQHLYQWLIRKIEAGKIQEFDKEDFDRYCMSKGRKPYSVQWFVSCLKKLFDTRLVKLLRQFRGYGYKVQVFHPWQVDDWILDDRNSNKTFTNSNKTFTNSNKTFKKTTSNPDSVVPSYREDNREKQSNTNKYTSDDEAKPHIACPSLKDSLTALKDKINQDKGQSDNSIPKPKIKPLKSNSKSSTASIDKNLGGETNEARVDVKVNKPNERKVINKEWRSHLDKLDDLGIRENPTIRETVRTTATKTIEAAIELYRQRRRNSTVIGNPCGYFMQIIKEGWSKNPQEQKTEPENQESQIQYWFELAKRIGVCSHIEDREDGETWVCMSGAWEKFSDAWNRGYNLNYLRKRNN